jgi:hypothetical protein
MARLRLSGSRGGVSRLSDLFDPSEPFKPSDLYEASALVLATALHGDDDEIETMIGWLRASRYRTLILMDVHASARLPFTARGRVPNTPEARAALWVHDQVRRMENEERV